MSGVVRKMGEAAQHLKDKVTGQDSHQTATAPQERGGAAGGSSFTSSGLSGPDASSSWSPPPSTDASDPQASGLGWSDLKDKEIDDKQPSGYQLRKGSRDDAHVRSGKDVQQGGDLYARSRAQSVDGASKYGSFKEYAYTGKE